MGDLDTNYHFLEYVRSYTLMVLNFCLNNKLHVISTNFETRLPRYNLSFSREVETLSCYWYGPVVMKLLSEHFF